MQVYERDGQYKVINCPLLAGKTQACTGADLQFMGRGDIVNADGEALLPDEAGTQLGQSIHHSRCGSCREVCRQHLQCSAFSL